jgi:hypothetical protein
MNRSPDLLDALRAEIREAPVAELPAIGGSLEALRLEIQLQLSLAVMPSPLLAAAASANGNREPSPAGDVALMDVEEVAAFLKVKPGWIYRHKDKLKPIALPGSRLLRFSRASVERFQRRIRS